ncbi:MAG: hypothetical protein JXR42_05415 [Gammaproteobacteria bacterium]|nr:hypothetical protein [Gammaproteobacteria bacterium]
MVTNDKPTKRDEYTLNDRDDLLSVTDDGLGEESSPKVSPHVRKIIIIAVVIGIVITAYNLITPSKKIESVEKKSVDKYTTLTTPPMTTKASSSGSPAVLTPKIPDNTDMSRAKIHVDTTSGAQDVSDVKKMVGDNAKQLQNLMLHLGAADKVIIGLNKTIQSLQLEVQQLRRDVMRLNYHKKLLDLKNSIKPRERYHIRAIVPGRAWLISDRGDEVSVRMGSKLGPYGKVVAIDWQKGLVRTSSNLNIDYGSNDI